MKTKLLKEIRKRFSIIHYPNGINLDGDIYRVNVMKLIDNDSSENSDEYVQINQPEGTRPFCNKKANSEQEAINMLKNTIITRLKDKYKYKNLGHKRNTLKTKKVWYIK